MLTRLVVFAYEGLVEITLWLSLFVGGYVGLQFGHQSGREVIGLLIGVGGTFLVVSVFLGAALVLSDIRGRLVSLERSSKNSKPAASQLRNTCPFCDAKVFAGAKECPKCHTELSEEILGLGVE